jgi:hypothetical protein
MIAAFMAGYMGKTAYLPPVVQALESGEKLLQEAKRDFLETGPLSPNMLRARPKVDVRLDDIEKQHKKDQLGVNIVLGLGLPMLLAMHLAANPTVRQWVGRKFGGILGRWDMNLGIPDMLPPPGKNRDRSGRRNVL